MTLEVTGYNTKILTNNPNRSTTLTKAHIGYKFGQGKCRNSLEVGGERHKHFVYQYSILVVLHNPEAFLTILMPPVS